MPFIPPPYEELSPDGRRYFKLLGVSPHLIRMYDLLLEAAALAAVRRGFGGKAQATQIDLLILNTKRELDQTARLTSAEADRRIRDLIDQTRVRPPTAGVKDSNTSLSGGIHSRPVPSLLPGGGAVGIADLEELIHATLRPSGGARVPFYWRAQEFGSEHVVGRTLFGVFQPGESAPSPSSVRRHPVFEVRGQGETRHGMVVRNPIAERGFLREGAYDTYLFRKGRNKATEARAIAQMNRIGSQAAAGRFRRRG